MTTFFLIITTFSFGSLFHFTHSIPHPVAKWRLLDVISAVNESTWEHMKILISGAFFSTILTIILFDVDAEKLFLSTVFASIISAGLMPLIYYSYQPRLKENILALDIGLFALLCVIFGILTYYIYYLLVYFNFDPNGAGKAIWGITWAVCYIWTYHPPNHKLFRCPVTKKLGHRKR